MKSINYESTTALRESAWNDLGKLADHQELYNNLKEVYLSMDSSSCACLIPKATLTHILALVVVTIGELAYREDMAHIRTSN
jgi:hypothetical protein